MGFSKFLFMLGGVMFALALGSSYLKKSPFIFGKMPLDFTFGLKKFRISVPFGTGVIICFIINAIIFVTHLLTQN